jgi:CRISPR/Cas system-associated exonuclease Cas4 (RecB family)
MDFIELLRQGLMKLNDDSDLGDRSTYVGSSDVAGCPRKAVLSKIDPPDQELSTLIRFSRGHLAEQLIISAIQDTPYKWEYQKEVVHRDQPFKAHIDFVFNGKNILMILEVKTVSSIPSTAYESWIQQIHFQMGLLQEQYPKKHVRGSVLAIDLNDGKIKLYNDFEYNSMLYEGLLQKASHIWQCTRDIEVEPKTQTSPLCAWCLYRPGCPAYDHNVEIPELPIEDELNTYIGLKATKKSSETELAKLANFLRFAIANANPDGMAIKVGPNVVRTNERNWILVE